MYKFSAMIHYELLPWRRHWWRLPGLVILFVMASIVEYEYNWQINIPGTRIDRLFDKIFNSTLWASILMSWLLLRGEFRSGRGRQLLMTRLSRREVFWIKYGTWTSILFLIILISSILSILIWLEIYHPRYFPGFPVENPFSLMFNVFTTTDYLTTALIAPLCVYTYICMFPQSRWSPLCIITSGLMAVLIKSGSFYFGLHSFIVLSIRYPVISTIRKLSPSFVAHLIGFYGFSVIQFCLFFLITGIMILYVEKRFRDRVYGED